MLGVSLAGYTKETTPVTLSQSDLLELLAALRAGSDLDVVRRSLEFVLQALIEAEATEQIGAAHYERSASRTSRACQMFCVRAGPAERIQDGPCERHGAARFGLGGG